MKIHILILILIHLIMSLSINADERFDHYRQTIEQKANGSLGAENEKPNQLSLGQFQKSIQHEIKKFSVSPQIYNYLQSLEGFEGSGGGLGVVQFNTESGQSKVILLDLLDHKESNSFLLNKDSVINQFHNEQNQLFSESIDNFYQDAITIFNNYQNEFPIFKNLISKISEAKPLSYNAYIVTDNLTYNDQLNKNLQHPIAFYYHGFLYINIRLYNLMDNINKTALAIHESLRHLNHTIMNRHGLTTQEIETLTRYLLNSKKKTDKISNIKTKLKNAFLKIPKKDCDSLNFTINNKDKFLTYSKEILDQCTPLFASQEIEHLKNIVIQEIYHSQGPRDNILDDLLSELRILNLQALSKLKDSFINNDVPFIRQKSAYLVYQYYLYDKPEEGIFSLFELSHIDSVKIIEYLVSKVAY